MFLRFRWTGLGEVDLVLPQDFSLVVMGIEWRFGISGAGACRNASGMLHPRCGARPSSSCSFSRGAQPAQVHACGPHGAPFLRQAKNRQGICCLSCDSEIEPNTWSSSCVLQVSLEPIGSLMGAVVMGP